MAYLAVEGCKLEAKNASNNPTIKITSDPDTDVRILDEGAEKKVYFGSISFSVSGYSGGPATAEPIGNNDGVGSGTINGTGSHCTNNNKKALLKGDKVTISIQGTTGSGQSQHPVTVTDVIAITDAAQAYADVT